jgi:hypothetical protein
MGAEAVCRVTFNGKAGKGKARLETDVLQFRGGDIRLDIPFKQISQVGTQDGALTVTFSDGTASFALGRAAALWERKILHPPSRLDKIGVKADWTVSAIGIDDKPFLDELSSAVAIVRLGRAAAASDAIFFGATKASDLRRVAALKRRLKPNGALWVIRPKGRPEISEQAVMAAGKSAGLVDVKVVSFSSTHTAEKFMIPRSQRG